jgi:hypothetical protein
MFQQVTSSVFLLAKFRQKVRLKIKIFKKNWFWRHSAIQSVGGKKKVKIKRFLVFIV